jgi:hypothetical protein
MMPFGGTPPEYHTVVAMVNTVRGVQAVNLGRPSFCIKGDGGGEVEADG